MEQLRPGQKAVLQKLKEGASVAALLPTGYGKSRCYSFPAKVWKWRTVVVTPLKALMEDQQQSLQAQGVRAWALHSGQSEAERKKILKKIWTGDWELLLLSPEKLHQWYKSKHWHRLQELWPVRLFAVDEAHCAASWRNFRPSYDFLDLIVRDTVFRGGQILALSATLRPSDRAELERRWNVSFQTVHEELGRKNLYLEVRAVESAEVKWTHLCAILRELSDSRSAIIYCSSRAQTEQVAGFLFSYGIRASAFHAGLPESWKTQRTADFLRGRIPVLCATNAFGMGIHSSIVSCTIHWGLPLGLLEYWQQAGRAGRSGEAGRGILLWTRSDILCVRGLLKVKEFQPLLQFLLTRKCRKSLLAEHLGVSLAEERCGNCDNCLGEAAKRKSKEPWWLCYPASAEKNFLALLGE